MAGPASGAGDVGIAQPPSSASNSALLVIATLLA
jgi:hypothetical protein